MLKTIFTFTFLAIGVVLMAQKSNLEDLQPQRGFENIYVEKVSDDSLSSTFVIWVKTEVRPHFHQDHTEQVYVLEGTGNFVLGEEEITIKPGDLITIPKGVIHSVTVTSQSPMKVLSIQSPRFSGNDRHFVND